MWWPRVPITSAPIDLPVDSGERRRRDRVDLYAVWVQRVELESKFIARKAMTTAQGEESGRIGLGDRESGDSVADADSVGPVAAAGRLLESPGCDQPLW